MQRKQGYPVSNCTIKMPESIPALEGTIKEEDKDQQQRRLQLINFAHSQWGFNNWSWAVTKQDLDFVDFANGKYSVGVAAFTTIKVKSLDIHRENVGYATCTSPFKGSAIHQARKCAVTNALRETLLSFGGSVAVELADSLESHHISVPAESLPLQEQENNQNLPNRVPDSIGAKRKEETRHVSNINSANNVNIVSNVNTISHANNLNSISSANSVSKVSAPPVARTHPMPVLRPAAPSVPPAVPCMPRAPPPSSDMVSGFDGMSEEEARAERKRRQRMAQEEFRMKQMSKQNPTVDEKLDFTKNNSSFEHLLLEIPSQDVEIESSSHAGVKRTSAVILNNVKRRPSTCKLDIITTD